MAFAAGKYALGLCDYCGQQYMLRDLKKNWRGFKVCMADYEPKEPQLEPLKYNGDAIALYQPRPDKPASMDVYLAVPGDTFFTSVGMMPAPLNKPIVGVASAGTVQVVIT